MKVRVFRHILEVTLKRITRPTASRKFGSRRWTPSEMNTLVRFYNEGRQVEEIAGLLKRSKPSIYTRLTKLRAEGLMK